MVKAFLKFQVHSTTFLFQMDGLLLELELNLCLYNIVYIVIFKQIIQTIKLIKFTKRF